MERKEELLKPKIDVVFHSIFRKNKRSRTNKYKMEDKRSNNR